MKMSELNEKNIDQLKEILTLNKKELFNLRFQKSVGSLESPSRVSQVKKDVARILTAINKKKSVGDSNA